MEPSSGADGREPIGPVFVRHFDKYVLVRKLAEGGMAEIFLAKQIGVDGFEKNVVIKRMLRNLSQSTEFVDMFKDEARLASQLSHPNVVQILELGFADGCYFIAMEYLAGEDFSTVVRRAARAKAHLPLPVVLRVVADAALGLHFAHEMTDEKGAPLELVHRDVSPSNIFITYTGQVKVLDFGIARAETRIAQTAAGTVKGKYQYMSPEQAQAETVDRRSDVYALGVSLYEALTLRRPFARDTDLAILKAVLSNDYLKPRVARPDLPPALEDLVVKAVHLQAGKRFQTGAEFAAALESYLATSGTPFGSPALSQFMHSFFGEERANERQRIPLLAELKAQVPGTPSPGFPAPSAPSNPSAVLAPPGQAPPQERTPPIALRAFAGPSRPPWQLALGAGLAVAVLAVVVSKLFAPPPAVSAPPPVAVGARADSGPGATRVGAAPTPAVAPAALDAGNASSPPDAGTAAPPDAGGPAPAVAAPAPLRPVTLTGAIISAVVKKNAGPVVKCFELFKTDLTTEQGTVPVTLTIAASGRVTEASSPLGDKPVGKCLEQRSRAMRFPPHVDREVKVSIPFAWQVTR